MPSTTNISELKKLEININDKNLQAAFNNNDDCITVLKLLHQCLSEPGKFIFKDSAGPKLIEKTNETFQQLIDAKSEPKKIREILIQYGKIFLADAGEFSHKDDNGPWKVIEYLLEQIVGLNLYELDIAGLDDEIERLKQLNVPNEKLVQHTAFIKSLAEFRQTIIEDLKDVINNKEDLRWGPEHITTNEILISPPLQLVNETTAMLKKLNYDEQCSETNENILRAYGEKYQQVCNQPIEASSLFKAAATVALAGLGFIIGTPLGLIAGFFYGAGIFSPITAPVGLVVGAIGGPMLMRDVGKKFICKLSPRDSLWRYAFSKPTKLEKSANKLAQTASDEMGLTQQPGSFFYKEKTPFKKDEAEPFLGTSLNNLKLKAS